VRPAIDGLTVTVDPSSVSEAKAADAQEGSAAIGKPAAEPSSA
jgi:hypothetical protein